MPLPAPDALTDALDYADRWLGFRQRVLRVPGVQAAVLVGSEIAMSSVHGHADVESGTALTARHLFRIASHSKTFTATAVLQLVEAGRLRLDDTIGQLLPRLAGTAIADRTVRAMLSHASGISRDGEDADHWQLRRAFPDAETLMRIEKVPNIPMFRKNTAAFIHELPEGAISNVDGDSDYVRVQVLTNAGALDRDQQLAVVEQFVGLVVDAAGNDDLAKRTWVLLTEAVPGGWGLSGHASTNEELITAARAEIASLSAT